MKAATLSQSTSRIPQPAPYHTRAGPRIADRYPNQYTLDHMRRSAFGVVASDNAWLHTGSDATWALMRTSGWCVA